jgi:5-methylcytosine-specific restriction endonuclease McrA
MWKEEEPDMVPFDRYPGEGRELLGRVAGANCRHEYGLAFMQRTGQTRCAYCDADFAASYETWLTMALDHVVPASVCDSMAIPENWGEDYSNRVLACAACNGFRNRYSPIDNIAWPTTLEAFYDLRDRIFAQRRKLIADSHKAERAFFDSRPWEAREAST